MFNIGTIIKLRHQLEKERSRSELLIDKVSVLENELNKAHNVIETLEEMIKRMSEETHLLLEREYHAGGTNGSIYIDGQFVCHTIELPWRDNQRRISCIPEGRYRLHKRNTARFGDHIYVAEVEGRSAILFHPANNAATELQGCIAPVTNITGHGRGTQSQLAMSLLRSIVYGHIDSKKKVYVTILEKGKNETA